MQRGVFLAAQAIALMVSSAALGADYDWTHGSATVSWSDPNNWSPIGVPGAGDRIVFTNSLVSGPQTIDLGGARQIDQIVGQTLSGAYTLSNSGAGALEIAAPSRSAVLMTQDAPGSVAFNTNLLLSAAGEVRFETLSSSNRIIVNGNITSSAASGTTSLLLTGVNPNLANGIEVNGVISDGASARVALVAGDGAHADVHQGQVLLSGANTYSGPTVVNGASVSFNSIGDWGPGAAASALGAPATLADGIITMGSNTFGIANQAGTLRYVGTSAAGHSSNRPIRFVGLSPGATIDASGAGPLVLSGGISSTASDETSRGLILTGSNPGDNTIAGVIEDVPGLTVQNVYKNGPGKWVLSAANTYQGQTSINEGTLVVASGGRIGNSGASTLGLTISGGGVLRIDGGSIVTNYINRPSDAAIDFRSGTLTLVGPTSSGTGFGPGVLDIGTAGSGTLNVASGGMTALNVNINGADDALTVGAGGGLVSDNIDNSHGGNITVASGGVIRLNSPPGRLTTGSGSIAGTITGSGGVTKVGPGTVNVSGPLSYTGPTTVSEGTLHVSSAGGLSSVSALNISSGAVLELDSASTVYSLNGQGQIKLNNGNLIVGNNNDPLSGGGNFSGTISLPGSLTKRGGAILTLSGNNTYSGGTIIENGVLAFSAAENLGAGLINNTGGTLRYFGPGGTIDRGLLAGGSATLEASGGGPVVFSGAFSSGSGTLTLSGSNTGENAISSAIAGANLSLVKSGSGKWVLSGGNAYGGTTTINSGELIVRGPAGKVAGGSINILAPGVLTLDGGTISAPSMTTAGTFRFRSGTLNLGNLNSVFGSGDLVIGTDGPCALNITGGTNTFGNVILSGPDDSLTISGGNNTFGAIDLSHGGIFNFVGGTLTMGGDFVVVSGTVSSTFGGSGGLSKISSGTATLTSSGNSYAGSTKVQGGRLIIASSAMLPDASQVIVSPNATLEYQAGSNDGIFGLSGAGAVINNRTLTIAGSTNPAGGSVGTFTGSLSGSGSLIKSGNGTWTLGSNVSQNVQVNGGVLSLTGSLSGNTTVGSGTLSVDGGQIVMAGALAAKTSTSVVKLNGGSITARQIDIASSGEGSLYAGTLTWTAGTIHLTGVNGVNITRLTSGGENGTLLASPDRPFKNLLTLDASKSLVVDQTTTVGSGGTLTVVGGSLTTKALVVNSAGAFNFGSGTLHLTQATTFDSGFLGQTHLGTISAAQNLIVDGAATIGAPMTLSGGNIVVDSLINPQNLSFSGGTISIRHGDLSVPAQNFLSLSRGSVINVGGALQVALGGKIDSIGATMNVDGVSSILGQVNAIDSTLNFPGGLSGGGKLNMIDTMLSLLARPVMVASVVASGDNTVEGRMSEGRLDVSSGSFELAGGKGTSVLSALGMAGDALLRLNDNSMVIRSGDLAAITGQIRAGLAGSLGITGVSGDGNIRLGSMANGTSGAPIYTTFEGGGVLGGGEVLLKSTVIGDLNLDGTVTISDFIDMASNFGSAAGTSWQKGDVNYDGAITISDFIDMASHFGQAAARESPLSPTVVGDAGGSAVPEPMGMLTWIASACLVAGRSRKRRSN